VYRNLTRWRLTLYLGPDWGPARTFQISINKIAWFFQIRPKGFILRLGQNFILSYVASYVALFWRQIFGLIWCNWDEVFLSLNSKLRPNWALLLDHEHDREPSNWGSNNYESDRPSIQPQLVYKVGLSL